MIDYRNLFKLVTRKGLKTVYICVGTYLHIDKTKP